jgi:hypothetical protein
MLSLCGERNNASVSNLLGFTVTKGPEGLKKAA